MKKIIFAVFCFLTAFILSCGSSKSEGRVCESNLDCQIGEVCSGGECVADSSSGQDDGKEMPVSDNDTDINSDTDTVSNSDDDIEETPDSSPAESDKDTEPGNSDTDTGSDDDSEVIPEENYSKFIYIAATRARTLLYVMKKPVAEAAEKAVES